MSAPTISSLSTSGLPPSAGNTSGAGAAGQAPTGSVNDLFAQLKGSQWKGIDFPMTVTDFEIRHDLVIHKFADRDGAYVENTGRHPVQFSGVIPFLNYIFAAKNENWPQGNMYPYQWRRFVQVCLDGTSGTLVHPELGNINCKLEHCKTTYDGKVRGGVWVHATWIESDDTQADQLGQDLSQHSPIGDMIASADDLDEQTATLQAALQLQANPLPALEFSFDDLVNAVVGVIDIPTLLNKEFQGRCDNLIYQADRVQDAIAQADAASPLNWPIFQNCERLKDSAWQLKLQPAIAGSQTIKLYVVAKDSTMAELATLLGADIGSFIVLNASLAGTPVVPAGTTVSYYANAA